MKDKIEYAYISTLESPKTYQYSKFFGKEFVDSYKDLRSRILNSLDTNEKDVDDAMKNCIKKFDAMEKGGIIKNLSREKNTEIILSMLLYAQRNINLEDKDVKNQICRWLNIFTRKYEVSKRIFSQYSNNMEKIGENYREIDNYVLLALNLALFYQSSKNLKFINTVLKINDMLCGMKDHIKADALPLFYLSLKIELDEIRNLFEEKGLRL